MNESAPCFRECFEPGRGEMNVVRVGPKDDREQEKIEEVRANAEEGTSLQEGGDGDGEWGGCGCGCADER